MAKMVTVIGDGVQVSLEIYPSGTLGGQFDWGAFTGYVRGQMYAWWRRLELARVSGCAGSCGWWFASNHYIEATLEILTEREACMHEAILFWGDSVPPTAAGPNSTERRNAGVVLSRMHIKGARGVLTSISRNHHPDAGLQE